MRGKMLGGEGASPRESAGVPPSRKAKISIAIDADHWDWAAQLAKRQKTSVSALIGEGLALLRRRHDLDKLLEVLGDSDELTDAERAQIDAEFREAGLIP